MCVVFAGQLVVVNNLMKLAPILGAKGTPKKDTKKTKGATSTSTLSNTDFTVHIDDRLTTVEVFTLFLQLEVHLLSIIIGIFNVCECCTSHHDFGAE